MLPLRLVALAMIDGGILWCSLSLQDRTAVRTLVCRRCLAANIQSRARKLQCNLLQLLASSKSWAKYQPNDVSFLGLYLRPLDVFAPWTCTCYFLLLADASFLYVAAVLPIEATSMFSIACHCARASAKAILFNHIFAGTLAAAQKSLYTTIFARWCTRRAVP